MFNSYTGVDRFRIVTKYIVYACILRIYQGNGVRKQEDGINIRWHWHALENFVLHFMMEVISSCTITYMLEVKRKQFAESAFYSITWIVAMYLSNVVYATVFNAVAYRWLILQCNLPNDWNWNSSIILKLSGLGFDWFAYFPIFW